MSMMNAAELREELHQFINKADLDMLLVMYSLSKADDSLLTEDQEKDLHLRIEDHKAGPTKSYTWAEAREMILKKRE